MTIVPEKPQAGLARPAGSPAPAIPFVCNDGGRQAAGFRGPAGDCVCRAVAIVTERPYREVYRLINQLARDYPRLHDGHSTARTGVSTPLLRHLMRQLGLTWHLPRALGRGVGSITAPRNCRQVGSLPG